MNTTFIARDMYRFRTYSEALEQHRQAIVKNLSCLVETKIVPEILQILPAGYSIDVRNSTVVGIKYDNNPEAATKCFGIELRLNHNGKPIGPDEIDKVAQVQGIVENSLKEIKERYSLEELSLMGEPVNIG